MPEGNSFVYAVPKNAKVKTITSDGSTWDAISVGDRKEHIETLIREAEKEGFDALRVNNIQEGPQIYLPGHQVTDDFIIFNGKSRKVLTGNNGNLDPNVKNNFGGIAPYIIPTGATLGLGMLNNE